MSTVNLTKSDMKKICCAIIKELNETIDYKFSNLNVRSINNDEIDSSMIKLEKSMERIEESFANKSQIPSGYILYTQHQRAALSAQGNQINMKQLAKMWSVETESVQSEWNKWATSEKTGDAPSTGDLNDIYSTAIAEIAVEN